MLNRLSHERHRAGRQTRATCVPTWVMKLEEPALAEIPGRLSGTPAMLMSYLPLV